MNKVDFHTHIIPYIDDGSKNLDVSLGLISEAVRQNITDVVLTPHFKGHEKDVSSFVKARSEEFCRLNDYLNENDVIPPKIYLGAEVLLNHGLSEYTNIHALCIENTNYMLLEMPYIVWYEWVFDEIYSIIHQRGITPIIAHIERYPFEKVDWNKYERLFSMDVVLQFNAESFCKFSTRRLIHQIVKKAEGLPVVIGSDCHDLKYRNICMDKAYKIIKKSFGSHFLNKIFETSKLIIKNEKTNFFDF